MNKPLTDLLIKNRMSSDKREEIPDGKIAGLYLVVQPTGAKSWAVRYRAAGKPRKLTIGPYPGIDLATARKRAQEALGSVAKGDDPALEKKAAREAQRAEKRAALDLVETVVDSFIERYAKPNTRDWRETERLLQKDVIGEWRGRRLSEIGKADVHTLLDKIIDRGAPVGANRTFAQLRKMCRWSVQRGLISTSPCDGLTAPSSERSRDRVLEDQELQVVWTAAGAIGFPFGPIIRLLILTGQRRDEVAHAAWSEIDIEKKLWIIPAERAKNRRAHAVPLSEQAVEILKSLPRFTRKAGATDFLFSGGNTPPSGFGRAKQRLDKEILKLRQDAEPLAPFVLHDLRRSVASGMARIGIQLHVIERCMNHVSGTFAGIVGVYQRHSFADEMRTALDAWARHIERIASGAPTANVVALAAARS